MQRFSLSRVRHIMQNQPHSRLLSTSTALSISRTRFAVAASGRQGNTRISSDGEEAWTQYDGLGPVSKVGRDPAKFERNWRQNPREIQSNRNHSQSNRNHSQSNRNHSKTRQARVVNKKNPPRKASKPTKQPFKNMDPSREIINQAYLDNHCKPISRADFPNAPSALFNNQKGFLWDHQGVDVKSSFISQSRNMFRCMITVTVRSINSGLTDITAAGEAPNKKLAERVASTHIIHKLHEQELLRGLLSGGAHELAGNKDLLNEERDAKMDVYNYCARFNTVPKFTTRMVSSAGHRKSLVEVSVIMLEQGIRVHARASERMTADILACVEFKRKAEEHHAKHGDEDIIVKDVSNALNCDNASEFFRYYQLFHDKRAQVNCSYTPKSGGKINNNIIEAQLYLDGSPIGDVVEWRGKKNAEAVAYLTGAVALKDQQPEIFPRFIEELKRGNGEILKPVSPEWININPQILATMTHTMVSVNRIGLPPTIEEIQLEDEQRQHRPRMRRRLDHSLVPVKSKKMREDYEYYKNNPKLEVLRQKRQELPMNFFKEKVLELVNGNEFSIIVGATGSGKTTQVPQILLEHAIDEGKGAECNIICTQPRRIAATSVAQRVAVERNEPLQKSIGYHVRFDPKLPLPGGSVTYCTTGILLQQLRHSPDEVLDGITHLVIDEVHERDIMIDYLLIILKRVMKERKRLGKPEVKVVLMSATMDTELFANYFRHQMPDGSYTVCPSLSVPGRTFPVKEYFLDDIQNDLQDTYSPRELNLIRHDPDTINYLQSEKEFTQFSSRNPSRAVSPKQDPDLEEDDSNEAVIRWKQQVRLDSDGASYAVGKEMGLVPIGLAAITLAHITKTTTDGAILVFLPGLDEILKVEKALLEGKPLGLDFSDTSKYRRYLLHSSIPNQNEVFEEVPPEVRKIILSTNIAETSVTIPDVQYVIDTGKMREKQYEQERRITSLVCTWVSKSSSKQRAGRAGRVQNGNYYALFSQARHDSLRVTGLPEILRSDLQEICLDIKLQGFIDPVAEFLSEAIEAPKRSSIEASLRQLRALGALTQDEKLTPLGRALATMPIEPSLGKMIVLAVIFRCLDPMIILGASSGGRDIFVNPLERRAEAQRARVKFIGESGSDHMAVINAYREWRKIRDEQGPLAAHRFSEQNFLHRGALRTLDQTAKQIMDILGDIGIIPRQGSSNIRSASVFGSFELNENSECVALIKALTLAGMYPNIAVCTGGRRFRTIDENFVMLHPSSVHYTPKSDDSVPIGTIMTYSQKARSNDGNAILLRENTMSSPLATILFGGRISGTGHNVEIDDWLPFIAKSNAVDVIKNFRGYLDRLLANCFHSLYKRDSNITRNLADDPVRETFATGLVEVLDWSADDERYGEPRRNYPNSNSEWTNYGRRSPIWGKDRKIDSRRDDSQRDSSRSRGPYGANSWR